MDERGVNQKTYKDLKADISQHTACLLYTSDAADE